MTRLLLRLRPLLTPFLRSAVPFRYTFPRRHHVHHRKLSTQPTPVPSTAPAADYHLLADTTLNELFEALEVLAEADPDIDVEFSAGVLTLAHPSGTYVFNKQPPNRQIWVSSPVSGPKRYDFHAAQGEWLYSRDGSSLRGLCAEELGVELGGKV